ncbi:lipopolysaccharide-processing protein [Sinorhizobium meliloti]|nr:lipopolysaccharide-processing protein [Sinorhizobium meliloti]
MKNARIKKTALQMSRYILASKQIQRALKLLGLPAPKAKKVSGIPKPADTSISVPGYEVFALHGEAWQAAGEQRPIILMFGVHPWKRDVLARYFSEFRVAYARKNTPWTKVQSSFSQFKPHAFVFWGMTEKRAAKHYAIQNSIPLWRVEDGFLRSVGLGAQHILPLSLAVDTTGIYFDPSRPSILENLISEIGLTENASLIERARRCMSMISAFGLSKYNVGQDVPLKRLLPSDRKRVLVVGQVEDDASIVMGCAARYTNNDIVRIARKENPDAEVIYRPHPDVIGGHRKEFSNPRDVTDICTILSGDYDLSSLLDSVDHVYTITSLLGFEALIRCKKVTVFGAPFYSGWGLTDDRQPTPRRTAKPSLDELFAAAYILYPRYCVGGLGNSAEIEHAIMALALEKNGVPRGLAEGVSSALPAELINVDLVSQTLESVKSKTFLIQEAELFATADSEFFRLLLESSGTEDQCLGHFVSRALEGPVEARIFEKIGALVQAGGDGDALAQLNAISVSRLAGSDAPHLVNCLALAGRLDDAQEILNRKAQTLHSPVAGDDMLPLLEAYRLLRAAQGKFGRKPVNAEPLWRLFQDELASDLDEAQLLRLLPYAFEHLSHFRMIEEMKALADGQLRGVAEANVRLLLKIALVCVNAFFAVSKRPELSGHDRHRSGRFIFKETEATISGRYLEHTMPFVVAMQLLQMAITVDDVDSIEKYKAIVFGRAATKGTAKAEVAELKKTVSVYVNKLFRAQEYTKARAFLASIKESLPEEFYLNLVASCYTYERKYGQAEALSLTLLKKYRKNSYRRKLAVINANRGSLEKAVTLLDLAEKEASAKHDRKELAIIREERARVNFLRESSRILSSVPQPRLPKGVVFLCSSGCLNTISMTVPVLLDLKRRGYAVIQLDEGMLINEATELQWIDKHAGMVNRVIHSDFNILDGLKNKWIVNWSEKQVEAEGINFYQGLFEIMTQRLRAFNFDINDPAVYRWFRHYLVRCDEALSACLSIKREILARGMPVRFINAGSHSAPFSVYRSFALKNAEKYDVGFVHMGPAYENYYSNLKSKVATTVSLDNLTNYPLYRLPFLARPDRFEEWLKQDGLYERYREDIDRVLNHNRVGRLEGNTSHSQYEEVLIRAKQAGRKVIGVYGKILCDMAVPFDGGPGHENIADWLRHTVATAQSTSNLIVLKPHPHELRPEIARDLNEYWLDLIAEMDIPENVLILPHTGFNNQDLIKYLDLAVLWNGTSSLELCAQGVPVVMASYFGKHDYPIDLIYPESRSDYERIICADEWERPDQRKMERAALLLKYMGTEEVCVPFRYSHRPVTNDPVGVPYWHMDEVEKFLRDGDPHISKLADKVFALAPSGGEDTAKSTARYRLVV